MTNVIPVSEFQRAYLEWPAERRAKFDMTNVVVLADWRKRNDVPQTECK